jgi:benzoate-CoA ligase
MQNNFAKIILDKNNDLDKVFIVDDTRSLTYKQLSRHVANFSAAIENKFNPGDRVILLMDDCVEWPVAFLSVIALGGCPVLASIYLEQRIIDNIIELSSAKLIITSLKNSYPVPTISKEDILSVPENSFDNYYDWHPDENCWWYLTSGTSGDPKCMVHRHQNLFNVTDQVYYNILRMTADSVVLATPKLQFAYGFPIMLSTLYTGATQILNPGKPVPSIVFKKLDEYKVTNFFTAPFVLNSILKHKRGAQFPKSVEYLLCSSEPLPESLARNFSAEFDIPVINGIGMAELGQTYCIQDVDNPEFGTVGRPVPGVEFELRNEDGTLVRPGEVGELYVKSKCMATFYWKNWQKTKDTFYGPWLRTGDLLIELPSGNYKFVSRVNGAVKINGEYVTPTEIESAILENETVLDCMVVFKYKEVGEIHAHVVTKNHTELNLKDYLKHKLPAHKIPKYFNFTKELPTTVTGKKLRRAA